jgi:succinyl-diaminopimelate desuccinylase
MDKVLQELIAIPSVAGDLTQADRVITYCAEYLTQRHMHVMRYTKEGHPSLMATTRPTKRPKVLLAAHLDVMAAPTEMFTLRLENGIYHGRGAWDMKFAAALYLQLVDDLTHQLANYDFGIMLTTDEETYGEYGTGFLVEEQGYRPSVAILPDAIEPGHIQVGAKGCVFLDISVSGVSAHGSRPWEGDSASLKLVAILQQVAELFKDGQQMDTPTLNIGMIHSGTMFNQIPDSALATLDLRFPDMAAFQPQLDAIYAICTQAGATCKPVGETRRPVKTDLHHPLVATFLRHFTQQTGRSLRPYTTAGTSDARYFTNHNIPFISASPKGGGYHADNEWLDAADYQQFKLVLRAYLDDIAKVAHSQPQPDHEVALTTVS